MIWNLSGHFFNNFLGRKKRVPAWHVHLGVNLHVPSARKHNPHHHSHESLISLVAVWMLWQQAGEQMMQLLQLEILQYKIQLFINSSWIQIHSLDYWKMCAYQHDMSQEQRAPNYDIPTTLVRQTSDHM